MEPLIEVISGRVKGDKMKLHNIKFKRVIALTIIASMLLSTTVAYATKDGDGGGDGGGGSGDNKFSISTFVAEIASKALGLLPGHTLLEEALGINQVDVNNAQIVLNSVTGTGGYSNTEIFSAVSGISAVTAKLEEYMGVKYMTKRDLAMYKSAVYLSQFVKPLNENLLNVTAKIKQGGGLDTVDISNTIINGYSIADTLTFIESNYYKTPIYRSTDGKNFEIATVEDLFGKSNYSYYIKDTEYAPSYGAYSVSTGDVSEALAAKSAVSPTSRLATVDKGKEGIWLPFMDYTVRGASSELKLTDYQLTPVDTYRCILTDSTTVESQMNIILSTFKRSNPEFEMSALADALGANKLVMDSFGNILSDSNSLMIMPAMMNPTLMAGNNNELINLMSYPVLSGYTVIPASFSSGTTVYLKKKLTTDSAAKEWSSAFLDKLKDWKTAKNDYFICSVDTNFWSSRSTSMPNGDKSIAGDANSVQHIKRLVTTNPISIVYTKNDTSIRKIRGEVLSKGKQKGYSVGLVVSSTIDNPINTYNNSTLTFMDKNKSITSGAFTLGSTVGTAFTTVDYTNLSYKDLVSAWQGYCNSGLNGGKDILSSTYLFNPDKWTTVTNKTQEFINKCPQIYTELSGKAVADGYECKLNSTIAASSSTSATDTKNTDIVMAGVGIYDASLTLDQKIQVYNDLASGSERTENYQGLLFSIFKNTSSNTERLKTMGELSDADKEELKNRKSMEIINAVAEMLKNPITTILKTYAGFLQAAHTGLTSGGLQSLFYISQADIDQWMSKLPALCFMISVLILGIRAFVLVIETVFRRKASPASNAKKFGISVALVMVPVLSLQLIVGSVTWLSDSIMTKASLKYATLSLENTLSRSASEAASTTSTTTSSDSETAANEYFIQHFTDDSSSKITIKEVDPDNSTVDELVYSDLDLAEIVSVLDDAANTSADWYKPDKFTPLLQDSYENGVFYYFLDYYMTEYMKLKSDAGNAVTVGEDPAENIKTLVTRLSTDSGTFENKFSTRSYLYGDSAFMSGGRQEISDIYGLGYLFYNDGTELETRDNPFPIELFDTAYHDDMFSSTSNLYWLHILENQRYFKNKLASTQAGTDPVIMSKPAYNRSLLAAVRPTVKTEYGEVLDINPYVIAGKDVVVSKGIKTSSCTPLEFALWKLNRNINSSVNSYFGMNLENVHDLTDVVMLASISTFEFNKTFGVKENLGTKNTIEPVGFDKGNLNLDIVLKTIFNKDNKDISTYDLMYDLVLNGYGFFAAVLLLVAEFLMMVYLVLRMFHLVQTYTMATIVCSVAYGWKHDITNKAWIGVLAQVIYFLLAHTVLIGILAVVTLQPFPINTFTATAIAFVLLVASILACLFEILVIAMIFRHYYDMGGSLVASKLNSTIKDMTGNLYGKFGGDLALQPSRIQEPPSNPSLLAAPALVEADARKANENLDEGRADRMANGAAGIEGKRESDDVAVLKSGARNSKEMISKNK